MIKRENIKIHILSLLIRPLNFLFMINLFTREREIIAQCAIISITMFTRTGDGAPILKHGF